jgi:RimJ/RimL family protein N-acetyltransferase
VKPPDSITDGVVALRKMRESDRAAILSTFSDPVVRRWLNMPAEPKDSDFDSVLRVIRNGFASGDRYDYCVTEPPDDVSLGAVIASRRHRDNYELAYLAREEGRGRGLMTRAVRLLCDWLFEQGVGRIEVRTHPGNEASQRLAERAGFQREGLERRSIWLHNTRHDAILWSLLPDDPKLEPDSAQPNQIRGFLG